jgi:hypothetical protein
MLRNTATTICISEKAMIAQKDRKGQLVERILREEELKGSPPSLLIAREGKILRSQSELAKIGPN